MKKNTVFILFFFGILVLFYYLFLYPFLTLDTLKQYRNTLTIFVEQNYTLSAVLYISSYALGVTFLLPVAAIFTILGGLLFGLVRGVFFSLIGATIGSTGSFLLVRYVIGNWFQERYKKYLTFVNTEIEKRGAFYLVSLRLLSIVPFFVVNSVAGLTKVSIGTFIITTILGILPGCIVFTYAGLNIARLESARDILSPHALLGFGLLGIMALVPLIVQKALEKKAA